MIAKYTDYMTLAKLQSEEFKVKRFDVIPKLETRRGQLWLTANSIGLLAEK